MYAAIHAQLVPESTYEQKYNERNDGQMSKSRKLLDGAKQTIEEKIIKQNDSIWCMLVLVSVYWYILTHSYV